MSEQAEQSREALEIARELEQCDNAERVHCFKWYDRRVPCAKCKDTALALDRFRAEALAIYNGKLMAAELTHYAERIRSGDHA